MRSSFRLRAQRERRERRSAQSESKWKSSDDLPGRMRDDSERLLQELRMKSLPTREGRRHNFHDCAERAAVEMSFSLFLILLEQSRVSSSHLMRYELQ